MTTRYTQRDLDLAQAAFERLRAETASGKERDDILRAAPGCLEGCARCTIKCAVIVGVIDDIKRDLKAQFAMWHNGRAYVPEGRVN